MLSDYRCEPDVEKRFRMLRASREFGGLLITGNPGSGKTRLLAALCREYLLDGNSVEFTTSLKFFMRLRESYGADGEEHESAVVARFCEVDFLALDDLGREGKITEHVLTFVYHILSARLDNYKPTAITTNLSFTEFARAYDAGIASRLGAYIPLALVARDRRNCLTEMAL